jgi:cation diffusion facilitator family transporter
VSTNQPVDDRYREIRRVTLVGSVVDLTLGIVKLVVGWLAHSQALIADGVHSLSDLVTDLLVLIAAKHAHREADADHPYGHGRIETAATVGLGVALIAVAIGIVWDAVYRLFHPELLLRPEVWALLAAALSVLAKEAVYQYTMRSARRLRSNLLRANAWHSRSDALSSVAVMVGVSGSLAGLSYVDAIAAIVVAVMVAHIGWRLGWSSVRELVDTGLDPQQLAQVQNTIMSVDGVETLHMLRTRRMGGKTLVDVHIILSEPHVSVSEGHQISETVRARLIKSDDDIIDVTVHIDPEDDEVAAPNRDLPLRKELLERLNRHWAGVNGAEEIQDITLHYLNGKVHIELHLPLELGTDPEEARRRSLAFEQALNGDDDVADVRVMYS